MSIYTTPEFWRGASERAIKTFAQALLGVLTGGATGVLDVDWPGALSAAALATLVSLLTSISQAEFTAGTPAADGYQGKHEAPTDPRHNIAD